MEIVDFSIRNLSEANEYLKSRSLDKEFCSLTKLGYLSDSIISSLSREDAAIYGLLTQDGNPYYKSHITFPTFTPTGLFSGFIGRATFDTDFKYRLPNHILFNKDTYIHGLLPDSMSNDYVFVSENMVEFGRVLQCGFQSLSLNGAFKSLYKIYLLAALFKHLIFILDNDFAGNELKTFIKTSLTDYPVKLSFIEHNEKGFDEFFVKHGKEESIKFLKSYV